MRRMATIQEIVTLPPSGFKIIYLNHDETYEGHTASTIWAAANQAGLWVDRHMDEDCNKYTILILSTEEREPNGN